MTVRLTSPAFDDGARIPARFTCEGEDILPALDWVEAPAGTPGYVLLCENRTRRALERLRRKERGRKKVG